MEHSKQSSAPERQSEPAEQAEKDSRLTVFFDGSCPLCQKEIGFIQRQRGSENMTFEDVSQTPKNEVAPGLSCDAAMARMHVRLPSGEIKSGAQAFLEMWGRLPLLSPFVRVLRVPPLPWILERTYRGFLVIRPRLQRWAGARSET